MRVLLVEDRDEDAHRLVTAVNDEGIEFVRVVSRQAAEDVLQGGAYFDLIVCDLRIPAYGDAMEGLPQHGLAVQATASRELPGTPLVFLTGVAEANIDELSSLTAGGAVSDVFADGGQLEMVRLFRKDRTLACAQAIIDLRNQILALDGIVLDGPAPLMASLTMLETRAARLAARQWHGVRAVVKPLGGGLSGSRTLHLRVYDESRQRASIFLKIDSAAAGTAEKLRYDEFISGTLSHSAFPHLTHLLHHMLGNRSCLIYKFADDWDAQLFDSLASGGDEALLVDGARSHLVEWQSMAENRRADIRQLRRHEIDDDRLAAKVTALSGTGLLESMRRFEDEMVEVAMFPQHGDLHGANVLCATSGPPTLIDCGDVGMHLAGLDPFTLELSLVVHPASHLYRGAWPTVDQAASWMDIDTYVDGCPNAEFVRRAREWMTEVADEPTRKAVAYVHLARQLKFDGAPAEIVVAMLEGLLS